MPRSGSRFKPGAGLDSRAAVFAERRVREVVAEVARGARVRAPAVKVWITARDERVRASHDHTDGQAIPENLRYKVTKGEGYRVTLMRLPRDESAPEDETINCRCQSVIDPDALRRKINETPVIRSGPLVRGEVECVFHRVIESEVGTTGDKAARFMQGAARDAVSRRRGR